MKRWIAFLLILVLTFSLLPTNAMAEAWPGEETFSLWNADAPALNALIEYVEAVTDPVSPDFIPEADRIATFDMDGTLMGELFPTYLEVALLVHRILADTSWEPDEEMLEFGRMSRDHALDKSFPDHYDYEFSYHQAKAFAGMTLDEYADFVRHFLAREADGFEGMTYAEAYYRPMVEVVEYLQDHGFKVYIVSGSERFIIRTFIDGMVDIPYENIIGSDTALAAKDQGDTDGIEYTFTADDTLVRTDKLLVKDLKTNKVLQIAQEIGRQPVLSFGNSSGDVSMNNYALYNNVYRSAAFMLIADDDVRDYGNSAKHDELTEKWQNMGYHVISMRDDWKTIYGENVVKTGKFHWLEETGAGEETFALWNPEAPALKALIEYVETVTNPDSPDFIPEEDRIATFDMDGTLMGELFPTYLEYYMLAWRILKDPDCHPDAEMLEVGRLLRDCALDNSFPADMAMRHAQAAAKAYSGMTLNEFADFVTKILVREVDGFEGMTYSECFYLPMVELVEYLQDNGFTCYICSGSDRFICRVFIEGMLDIPYNNVIGMDVRLEATGQGDEAALDHTFSVGEDVVRTDELLIKNLKTNKVLQIAQEIGQRPVLSFGNSSGDTSMHNYVISNNPYKSAAFMLVADDEVRDYGNAEKGAALAEKWAAAGYHVISMANDWKTIYGEDVHKTGEFHWLEELAEDRVPENTEDEYTLEQVVILSRHNLRAPLSSNGSVPSELTPHEWIQWSANSSELTLLGGIEETSMGQYFRKWLNQEGLIPENYVPEEDEVRFLARDIQRCRATARYFAAGMLPLTDIEVEHPGDDNGTEDFMAPVLHFWSDDYAADAAAQVAAMGGDAGFEGISEENRDVIKLIMDTVDMQDSEIYQSGKYGDLLADASGFTTAANAEPDITGAIKTVYSVADALILQYYEADDAKEAAFGHDLTDEDWAKLGGFMTTCLQMKHGAPLVAANITNPLLQELKSELENKDRKFSFFCAHDCTVLGTLSALGVEPYSLPESIETVTPIGVKLVFEKQRDSQGQAWYRVSLVYRSTEQIRSGEMLTLENPPMKYDLHFEGVATNEDGLIAEADLLDLFDRSIDKLGEMEQMYAMEIAA